MHHTYFLQPYAMPEIYPPEMDVKTESGASLLLLLTS